MFLNFRVCIGLNNLNVVLWPQNLHACIYPKMSKANRLQIIYYPYWFYGVTVSLANQFTQIFNWKTADSIAVIDALLLKNTLLKNKII